MIGRIPVAPSGDSPFLVKLSQRLIEGKDGMGRGGESKLAIRLKPLELAQEVQA